MVAAAATGPMDWEGEEESNAQSARIQVQDVHSPLGRELGCFGRDCPEGRQLPGHSRIISFLLLGKVPAVKWRV